MLEIHFDKRGETAIDNMADLMRAFPNYASRAVASALKSEGFQLKNVLQEDVRTGGHGGAWDKLNPHTGVLSRRKRSGRVWSIKNYRMVWKGKKGSKKRARQYKEVMLSTRRNPLLRLRGGIRYVYDHQMKMVSIGFINASSRLLKLVKMHAEGYSTPVTPRLRKMLFALGFPLKKSTKVLRAPARPLIQPAFKREQHNVEARLKQKYINNVMRYMAGQATKQAA